MQSMRIHFTSEVEEFIDRADKVEKSGIFTQSNYGIVTKIGMTLMPDPGGFEGFVSCVAADKLK